MPLMDSSTEDLPADCAPATQMPGTSIPLCCRLARCFLCSPAPFAGRMPHTRREGPPLPWWLSQVTKGAFVVVSKY